MTARTQRPPPRSQPRPGLRGVRSALALVALLLGPDLLAAAGDMPRPAVTLGLLDQRRQLREAALRSASNGVLAVTFSNRVEASGITFQHYAVDDAGRDYKAVQYDHGNAVAVADVDHDGKPDLYFTT